jgi:general secretion pathway protein H
MCAAQFILKLLKYGENSLFSIFNWANGLVADVPKTDRRSLITEPTITHPFSRAASRSRGFTMLEMIAVLLVIALAAALAPAVLSSGVSTTQHRAAAREVAQMLRLARTEAVAKRVDVGVDFDLEQRTLQMPRATNKRVTKIPEGIEIKLTTTAVETKNEKQASVRFYPDGGATGGRVTLKVREREFRIDIDWLTGRVSIDEAQAS